MKKTHKRCTFTGAQLRAERLALGLTQTELGALLDKHQITLSRYETGTEPIGSPRSLELALAGIRAKYFSGTKQVKGRAKK